MVQQDCCAKYCQCLKQKDHLEVHCKQKSSFEQDQSQCGCLDSRMLAMGPQTLHTQCSLRSSHHSLLSYLNFHWMNTSFDEVFLIFSDGVIHVGVMAADSFWRTLWIFLIFLLEEFWVAGCDVVRSVGSSQRIAPRLQDWSWLYCHQCTSLMIWAQIWKGWGYQRWDGRGRCWGLLQGIYCDRALGWSCTRSAQVV